MASRTMFPLRAARRRICIVSRVSIAPTPCTARTVVSTSKAKLYPQSSTSTSKSSPSSSSNNNNNNNSSTPPPFPPRSPAKPTAASRKPIPAVSGEPLPDAPSSSATPNNNGRNSDAATTNDNGTTPIDWSNSYHGLGTSAFAPDTAAILQARLDPDDIEVKPDGIIYLPEIKYRRILNAAFGPGGWGLAPRGELMVQDRLVTREYALVVHGRFVGQARGEQQYFSEDGVSTAAEGCKSNALMRCCKDLGIASELWDPRFIRRFMKEHAVQQWVEHITTKKKKQIWLRKDDEVRYPFKKS
ncbi:mitochondrial genome maintenance MGM101 [Xylariaceae sp. AK1471]|nr:mitochondrial genome maintenance MGM101 [Xylariaceae sp. AK1471]